MERTITAVRPDAYGRLYIIVRELLGGRSQAFRENGLTAAITALVGGSLAIAPAFAGGLVKR